QGDLFDRRRRAGRRRTVGYLEVQGEIEETRVVAQQDAAAGEVVRTADVLDRDVHLAVGRRRRGVDPDEAVRLRRLPVHQWLTDRQVGGAGLRGPAGRSV